LKEYWYPALRDSQVKTRPVGLKIMEEELVFFRGKSGEVAALGNVCPHRGGSLKDGDCHYAGTIACPYHGWVFDEHGECLAVLSEGPDSHIPGRAKARKYPTRTVKGQVFVWMGESQPVALEEDVPPEFFDDTSRVWVEVRYWPVNWRVALENALDSHVFYVHRDAVLQLREPIAQLGRQGYLPRVVNGKACIGYLGEPPTFGRHYFPALQGYWPKSEIRKAWLWLFRRDANWFSKFPPFNGNEEWDMHSVVDGKRVRSAGHHLPTMFRFDFATHMYTRCCVPVDENLTRIVYYHAVRAKTALGRLWQLAYYQCFHRWAMYTDFSEQDYRVMAPQRYDTPEMLSSSDAQVVAWRKLLLTARGMQQDPEPERKPKLSAVGD
jgi:phenylpropionate dioxygenase-like ring-hydroxylating dioxygenase large terminal subunit